MNRRDFIAVGGVGLSALSGFGFTAMGKPKAPKPAWLLEWIKIYDKQLANYAPLKITDRASKFAGAYRNEAEMPNSQTTSGFLLTACMLFGTPESVHYQSKTVLPDIEAAARTMLLFQHADGTIDYLDTNFHSTPDTAFVLENVIPAYRYLTESKATGTETALQSLKTFMKKAGEALIVGGIHTPNHRWVVSAALTKLNELFPDPRYTARIDQWLAEHIDIDPDGQFNEKSTNTYSSIVDRSLISIARGLNKPELLEPVRRNLLMTRYYVHPNGEVVTEASNRQDKGTIGNMARYYYCYRYMALHDKDGEMAAMCRLIETTCTTQQLAGFLDYFLEDPMLWNELPPAKPLPTNYAKAFPYSGVVRIRRERWDTTILSNNASFLTFHNGDSVLQGMRIAASFFGKGQFDSATIVQQSDSWVLKKSLEGPYYQPIAPDKIDPNGDWAKMPQTARAQSEIQKLDTTVTISETPNGLQIQFDLSGTEGVPVTLELIFRAGGTFTGLDKYPKKDNAWLLLGESGTYSVGADTIHFGPGRLEHKGLQLRGGLPAVDSPTVYLTGYTPFRHTLELS